MNPYGCHNRERKDSFMVKDGYWRQKGPSPETGEWVYMHRVIEIADATSIECQFTKANPDDQRCEGCRHRG